MKSIELLLIIAHILSMLLLWVSCWSPSRLKRIITLIINGFLIGLLLSSCASYGPTGKLKKAKRLIADAIEQGASVDSISIVTYDTIKVILMRDSVFYTNVPDTIIVTDLCEELIKLNSKPDPIQKKEVVTKLVKATCPEIKIDSTYNLIVLTTDGEFKLPINVKITNDTKGFRYQINTGELQIPYKKESNEINIETKQKILWWWLLIAFCLGVTAKWIFK
jgi:hypothetical protein